jgi:hypothetical protein
VLAWYALPVLVHRFAPPAAVVETIETDDRIDEFTVPCGFTLPFQADTSDMVHILVETLARGQRDPIKKARQELADMGPSVLPELERRFDASYAQAFEHGIVENVLGVCTIAKEDWGLELLRRGARHPKESVRMGALSGLQRHGTAADYDLVLGLMPLASTPQSQSEILGTLHQLDRERFGKDLAGWLERKEFPLLERAACAACGDIEDPDTIERLRVQAESRALDLQLVLLGPAARAGNEEALAFLRAKLGDPDVSVREQALQALARSGLGAEVHVAMELDGDRRMRLLAAQVVAGLPDDPETRGWLSSGLSDEDRDVRALCMQELCRRADPRAIAEALEALRGDARSREAGINALREAFPVDPPTVERTYDFVTTLYAERQGGDPAVLAGLLQTLSQVPGTRSAEFLLEQGRTLGGRISGWRPHRWCVHEAINTGTAGREVLQRALPLEHDPLRRIDLLEAITQDATEEVRATLRAIIDDPAANPYERVYAASRLVLLGPWTEVAPYLKRVYLATTDPVVRPALHCLLWAWYGAASER